MGNSIYTFQDVLQTNYSTYSYVGRGFLSGRAGAISAKGVDLSKLPPLTELRVLDLADRIVTPEDLSYVGRLPYLEVLVMNNTVGVTDDGLRQLSGLLNLRFLDIPFSQVTDDGLAALADLTRLEHLNLHEAKISGRGLRHLQGLQSLRSLYLSNTRVDDDGVAYLRGLKSLESVVLYNTRITDEALLQLRGLRKLKSLDISRTVVSLEAMESLRENSTARVSVIR
jgi:Leucine-rich repeat (LRR) protein